MPREALASRAASAGLRPALKPELPVVVVPCCEEPDSEPTCERAEAAPEFSSLVRPVVLPGDCPVRVDRDRPLRLPVCEAGRLR